MRRLRIWLLDNEVYFKTIATLIVAGASIFISWQALRIARFQAEIAKGEITPRISVQLNAPYDASVNAIAREDLIIANAGGEAIDAETSVIVFFIVTVSDSQTERRSYIPVSGFYAGSILGTEPVGVLAHWVATGNNRLNAAHAWRKFGRFVSEENLVGSVDIIRCVRVAYRDIRGDRYTRYFRIPNNRVQEVSKEAGEELFSEFRKKLSARILIQFNMLSTDSMAVELYETWRMAGAWEAELE